MTDHSLQGAFSTVERRLQGAVVRGEIAAFMAAFPMC